MSGIVLEYRRDGAPAERPVAEQMLDRLAHRGPDGRRLVVKGRVAFGCQHFRTTPEEAGETQPVAAGGRLLAFDGRLDNRDELLRALDRSSAERRRVSDARLVLEAYRAWGNACFDRLLGPFAIVLWDGPTRTVIAARDGLGDRSLYYNLDGRRLLIASEEHALLAHPEISARLDEKRLACFLAVEVPGDGSTFFADVRELRPGEVLTVTETGHGSRRCWNPEPDGDLARLSDADCVIRYRELLTQAVRCRLRSTSPPAVMMSGGLDSTSIAAVGARVLAAGGADHRMRAVSWIFDELRECDERPFMDLVVTRCGIEAWQVPGDDAWPLRDRALLSRNPSTPEQNPYRELKQRTYHMARAIGSRVVLNGASADIFSLGAETWLWDLLRAGRVLEAGVSVATAVRERGLLEAMRRAGLGALLRPIRRPSSRQSTRAPWLTGLARAHLDPAPAWEWWRDVFPRARQCAAVLGACEARSVSLEIFDASRAGVDLRHPYRDRRLTEFLLQVPASQLYRRGRYKHLARLAADGLLPPEIPARLDHTVLTPLFRRGVFERERAAVQAILAGDEASWPRWIERRRVEGVMRRGPRMPLDEVVLWHCLSMESWLRTHSRQLKEPSLCLEESAA